MATMDHVGRDCCMGLRGCFTQKSWVLRIFEFSSVESVTAHVVGST